jgi:hypothetical protein
MSAFNYYETVMLLPEGETVEQRYQCLVAKYRLACRHARSLGNEGNVFDHEAARKAAETLEILECRVVVTV